MRDSYSRRTTVTARDQTPRANWSIPSEDQRTTKVSGHATYQVQTCTCSSCETAGQGALCCNAPCCVEVGCTAVGLGTRGDGKAGVPWNSERFLTSCSPNLAPRRILDPITPAALSQLEQLARILDLPVCPSARIAPARSLIIDNIPTAAGPRSSSSSIVPVISPQDTQQKASGRVDAHPICPPGSTHCAGKWLPPTRAELPCL
jgi:hypothetical protein